VPCGLTTAAECWRLWKERQLAAGSDADRRRAGLAVETHLARIAQHNRLENATDPTQRAAAERLRAWFGEDFLHAGMD
jgi:hypothetical protein